jgi:uncharacterized membrane protein
MHKASLRAALRRTRPWLFLASLAVAGAVISCESGDRTLEAVDPEAVAANPTYDQVFAIIQNKCVLCHEGSGEGDGGGEDYRFVAAEDDVPGLETCTSIVALREDILARAEDNTMPPGALPRLTSEEKLIIRRWINNGAIAPCNPANPN